MEGSSERGVAVRALDGGGPVAVVAAYSEELRALRRRLRHVEPERVGRGRAVNGRLAGVEVLLMATGDGAIAAEKGLAGLLAAVDVEAVIGIGVAGGLSPGLSPRDLVVAGRVVDEAGAVAPADFDLLASARQLAGNFEGVVLSRSDIVGDPVAKARLWRRSGGLPGLAVDLESASWARIARDRGVPFLAARAICDGHDEALPLDFNRFRSADGGIDRGRVWRHALLHPSIVAELMRLRDRVQECAERLADFVEELVAARDRAGA